MKRIITLALAVIMILSLSACSSTKEAKKEDNETNIIPEKLVIGVIPTQNQGDMQNAMNKLGDHISKEIGTKVDVKVFPDYNGVVEAMNYGKVDLAYFGPLTYVIANDKSGADAIITMLVNGEPYYHSYIIAPNDSKLNNVDDLINNAKDLHFAFGDVNSTSGSLIPGILLKEKGVFKNEQEHDFKQVTYTGGHDATALAVQNKKVDAGAIDSAIFESMKKNKVVDEDKFKVIWKSDKLFQYPWAVKKDTPKELKEKLQEAFLSITDKEILDIFGADGFTKAKDSDYEPIREAAKSEGRI
ncbi:phosphate/phosphite/phosphonate ABC transporter substrate-binding protein [Tepidibacter aestuarii]|uniref:phosphate/phosphite/phosphonate ABC transporter substrate-binding protein n=1 Tax=Tepidibacter aestuarii TaxID=2925782 RepID=UPI0020BDC89B|nr:phosphate/phosphite/phosphonate ABC transporter substrate-binding protein [Tepidibacter aestuarii]CAH2214517.1 phosphonate transport system substrate-binding protein [Tepidibacter aestuarii]